MKTISQPSKWAFSLLLIFFAISQFSCGSLFTTTETKGNDTSKETTSTLPQDPKFTEGQAAMLNKCMGKGYRAELAYADISDVTLPLFDPSQLAKYTNIQLTGEYDESIIEGSTIKDYSQKLSASVGVSGSVGLFSASVSTSFNSTAYQNSENSFYSLKKVYHYYRFDLDPTKAPLLPQVKTAIDNMAPTQLFETYGTHFTQSVFIGARIVMNTYINKSEFSDETDFSASLKASYGAVSGDASVSSSTKKSTKNFSSNSNLQIFGGDPLLSGNIINGVGNKKDSYDKWVASTKVINGHTLADFGYNGLQPIAKLASTPARQQLLEEAMKTYLANKGKPLPVPKEIIKKNSTFILQSADDRFVTHPIMKLLPWPASSFYYPLVSNTPNQGGLLTFIPSSSSSLKDGNNVTIRFTDDALYPFWNEGKNDKETNPDFLKKRFLKIGGIAPMAHYWDNNSDANWIIKKVDKTNGTSIFNQEEVYIQHDVTQKYLTIYNSGGTALWVQPSDKIDNGTRDEAFIWKIRLAKKNNITAKSSN